MATKYIPSFSSSLLDAIYHSSDNPINTGNGFLLRSRDISARIDDEIESLRRAIRVEKWMETNFPSSKSGSSFESESTPFSSSETSASAPKLSRSKSRALRIYNEFKKMKEPISPGGRILSFLNSIFTSRNTKHVEKSRSFKDTMATPSRPCLVKNRSCRNNDSKYSVRVCSAAVAPETQISGQFSDNVKGNKKKKVTTFVRDHKFMGNGKYSGDFDDRSCCSSDLFELDIVGREIGEELPMYGTTSLVGNKGSIASRFVN